MIRKVCPNCGFDIGSLKPRSYQESRYFHGVVLPILMQHEHFGGWDKEEVKFFLKDKFIGYERFTSSGAIKIVPSEANLSTKEYEAWMAKIRAWASLPYDMGGIETFIPEPNESEPS